MKRSMEASTPGGASTPGTVRIRTPEDLKPYMRRKP